MNVPKLSRSTESKTGARPIAWSVRWAPAVGQYLACWQLTIGRRKPKWCTSLAGAALVLRQNGIQVLEAAVRESVADKDRARP